MQPETFKARFYSTNRCFGDVIGRRGLLVRTGRQCDMSSLQEVFILLRFAQLHALRDPFLAKFLQEDRTVESTNTDATSRRSAPTYRRSFRIVFELGDPLLAAVAGGHDGPVRRPTPIKSEFNLPRGVYKWHGRLG